MSVSSDLRPLVAGNERSLIAGAGAGARAVVAAGAVAAIALPLGALMPSVGAPIIALALGMALAAVIPAGRQLSALGSVSRNALQTAIVLLGATISLSQVVAVGASSLPVMLGSLATSLLAAALIGRQLGVPSRLRVLVGVGTGICGASAIASVAGVIGAEAREIRYAISTIFVFNLAAVLLFPALGHVFGLGAHEFGLWSGTAVNDTSSVLAAGFAYGHTAGTYALIVKLTRTTMIIPITLWLATATLRRSGTHAAADTGSGPVRRASKRLGRVLPWFLVWFVVASAADSLGMINSDTRAVLSHVGFGLTTLALAAVGLSSNLRELRQTGMRPLVLGALVWAAVAITSLALQAATAAT
jgi:uncharacterized integral membrane protein (TIGR00698 family)